MKSGIYMIINLKNSKIYIGSSVNMAKRKREHFNSLRKGTHYNSHLQKSFNKHGEENFRFVYNEYAEKEKLFERENYWIHLKKSLDSKYGYNISIPNTDERLTMRPETIEKKVIKAYYQWYGDNPRISLEDFLKGKRARDLIVRLGCQTKIKILGFDKNTGELINTFDSISELSRSSKIRSVIGDLRYSYKGMVLIEERNYNPEIVYKQITKEKKERAKYERIGRFKGYPVETFNLETKEVIKQYSNSDELASELGTVRKHIQKAISGERKSFRGMGVRYSE